MAQSSVASKISVVLDQTTLALKVGKTGQLTATTSPAGKAVVFSSSDSAIASVSKTGLVTAEGVGTATIAVTTADALSATCAVTVTDEDVPTMPTSDHELLVSTGNPILEDEKPEGLSATKDAKTGVTTVTWTADAAKDTNWKNDVGFAYDAAKASRATKINYQIRANKAITVYYKLVDESFNTLLEGEKTISTTYQAYSFDIPVAKRYLLAKAGRVMIYIPKSGTSEAAGTANIANVYFSGDAEPGIEPGAYDPTAHSVLYEYEFAHANDNKGDYIDDQTTGKVAWAYSAASGIVITNADYNDWAPLTFKFPENNAEGTAIDYSGCTLMVIKLKASAGVLFKFRNGWSADMQEKQITADLDNKEIYLSVETTAVTPWTTVAQIVGSYRLSGYETGTLTTTIESIQIVKDKA